MIIPILGHFGVESLPLSSGASCSSGFKLQFLDGTAIWRVGRYIENESYRLDKIRNKMGHKTDRLVMLLSLLFFSPILLVVITVINSGLIAKILIGATGLLLSFFWAAAVFIFWLLRKDRETREWHACEHKSYMLLKEGLEPTVENLRACPAIFVDCGTSLTLSLIELASALWLIFFLAMLIPIQNNAALSLVVGAALIALTMFLLIWLVFWYIAGFVLETKLEIHAKILQKFMPLFWPVLALPVLIQKYCAIKEPSENKLRQTAEELGELLKNYQKTHR